MRPIGLLSLTLWWLNFVKICNLETSVVHNRIRHTICIPVSSYLHSVNTHSLTQTSWLICYCFLNLHKNSAVILHLLNFITNILWSIYNTISCFSFIQPAELLLFVKDAKITLFSKLKSFSSLLFLPSTFYYQYIDTQIYRVVSYIFNNYLTDLL